MAKKKIYAVRKGHKTGLFNTWAECQKATAGYSGAEFKSFTDKEEAIAFLEMKTVKTVSGDKDKEAAGIVEVPENMVIAYVDGSFEKSIGRYAFGCVKSEVYDTVMIIGGKKMNISKGDDFQYTLSDVWITQDF